MDRNAHIRTRQQRFVKQVCSNDTDAVVGLLAGSELVQSVQSLLPPHRQRIYPPLRTLSMFVTQALSADRACQNAVNAAALRRIGSGQAACSTRTGGYCQARERLNTELVSTLARRAGQAVCAAAPVAWRWRGRAVRLVDGTTLRMPDTRANQAAFPQPRTQQPGLGFPICRLLVLICLDGAALLDAAIGRYCGKGGDEHTLLRSILHGLHRGDVLIGDALYPSYWLLCALREREVDAVFEQHGARGLSTDFRRGKRLGARDHLIVLQKPARRPGWMSVEQYWQLPEQLTVRELHSGGKTLVTTLLCPKETSKTALRALYGCRWHVELDLRSIKSTLGMHMLSCQSPAMIVKEIWVYLLAYNLIRLLMAKAAALADMMARQLSFKHALQVCNAWTNLGSQTCCEQHLQHVFALLAQQRVGKRPGRVEPRAIKRRPPAYPLLTVPRHAANTILRRRWHTASP